VSKPAPATTARSAAFRFERRAIAGKRHLLNGACLMVRMLPLP